jgi:septal ring factor EnvC (AmiA/AmiB activator)
MNEIKLDDASRVNLSLRLLWAILAGVAVGGFALAANCYHMADIKETIASIERKLESFNQRIEDHERRLIKIETKAGIAKHDTR